MSSRIDDGLLNLQGTCQVNVGAVESRFPTHSTLICTHSPFLQVEDTAMGKSPHVRGKLSRGIVALSKEVFELKIIESGAGVMEARKEGARAWLLVRYKRRW
jgi:hypothetical protein